MSVELDDTGPIITDDDINAFEARIGHILPDSYRAFLINYNGGQPNHHVIRSPTTGDLGVQIFFGIRDDEFSDIDAEFQTMRDRVPSRLVSFAIDDFGNRFCFSLGPPDYGKIYFWNHEEEAEEREEPTELNLYHLADSFTEFWDRMEPIDRDEYLAESDSSADAESQRPRSDVPPAPPTNGESP